MGYPQEKERYKLLHERAENLGSDYIKGYFGRTLSVLFEGNKENDTWQGYSENYIKVAVRSSDCVQNAMLPVKQKQRKGMLCLVI